MVCLNRLSTYAFGPFLSNQRVVKTLSGELCRNMCFNDGEAKANTVSCEVLSGKFMLRVRQEMHAGKSFNRWGENY